MFEVDDINNFHRKNIFKYKEETIKQIKENNLTVLFKLIEKNPIIKSCQCLNTSFNNVLYSTIYKKYLSEMIFISPSIINFMIKLSSFDLSKIFGSIDEKTEFFSEIKAILYYALLRQFNISLSYSNLEEDTRLSFIIVSLI